LGTAAQLIRELNDAMGLTSVVVSHDLNETFQIADHVVTLANGKVASTRHAEDVRNSPDPLVRQFVRRTARRAGAISITRRPPSSRISLPEVQP